MTGDVLSSLVGTWSARPPDFPSKVALGAAIVLLITAALRGGERVWFEPHEGSSEEQRARARTHRRRFLLVAALAAAILSVAYISSYLLGGPRIIDATTYWLQGRALSHGDLAWPAMEPSASFRGRFLFYRETAEGAVLGGIFPPGYPLALAVGFWLGAPMIIGPLLAAALVVATYRLARALARDGGESPANVEAIGRTAALISVMSAALRYHTADTMSHGATALGITIGLERALSMAREERRSGPSKLETALLGLALGYVAATRPVSSIPITLVACALLASRYRALSLRAIPFVVLGAAPFVMLLLASQKAVTGSWLTSTQKAYYAISDGPPGCFRYGFGSGVGCVFEHGDFVSAHLTRGYGLVEALGTTLRRLRPHLLDIANLEVLAPLVLVPLKRRSRSVRAATALLLLHVLAYVPFYFDGNYPGGGARLFADILPVEHALLALGIATFRVSGAQLSELAFARRALVTLALMLLGFAVHASFEHIKLRERDRGPMFEPDVLSHASLSGGLIFVDTDHGFALGHDPSARQALENQVVIARLRNDDNDRLLYEALDRPPTYLYRYDPNPGGTRPPRPTTLPPALTPWAPPEPRAMMRFEGESEWPPLALAGGIAVPGWVAACASNRRALVLTPTDNAPASATISIPIPVPGRYAVELHMVDHAAIPHLEPTPPGQGTIRIGNEVWPIELPQTDRPECWILPLKELDFQSHSAHLQLEARGGAVALDWVGLRRVQ